MSSSQEPDVFRRAEAALFRVAQPDKPLPDLASRTQANPPRRILQAIEEPPAPLIPSSYEAPAPRGRRPGSMNKPKADSHTGIEASTHSDPAHGTSKPRGRPVGSKNRSKDAAPSEILGLASATPVELLKHDLETDEFGTIGETLPRRRGRPLGSKNKSTMATAVPPLSRKDRNALAAVGVSPDELAVVTPSADVSAALALVTRGDAEMQRASQAAQGRLRERSKILRRYVWGTDPRPGERGYQRARG